MLRGKIVQWCMGIKIVSRFNQYCVDVPAAPVVLGEGLEEELRIHGGEFLEQAIAPDFDEED